MSILKKPYQLSIWEDVWDGDNKKFVEQRIAIIGTDTMESQSRALEPNLTTKINGEKKLTFKMYKQYIDTATGEKVDNPFVEQLISERKVKLNYKGQWFDFIVKNVDENSSTHLCTYQLEDALVQELSKNGFNVVLDEKERNNSGTAKELAEETLKETDWTVDSELFVQTLDEPLVYLTLTRDITATLLLDPTPEAGVEEDGGYIISAGTKVLGFYSSCTNKPVRFQFLYIPNLANVKLDENRVILEENCQYCIDYYSPDVVYESTNNGYDFFLPEGFSTTTAKEDGVDNVVISSLYRGRRYVFSQESEFIPVLNRYVNKYIEKSSQEEVYGYQNTEYKSPALVQNVITNSQFKNTSGWIGTRLSGTTGNSRATVESVYGYFDGGVFVDALEELKQGVYPQQGKTYTTYLKLVFTGHSDIVINSGPYDNRITIGNMELGEKWALKLTCLNSKGANAAMTCSLQECKYDLSTQGYTSNSNNIVFSAFQSNGEYKISEVVKNNYSTDGFKKNSQVRLVLSRPASTSTPATYYLQDIQLFRASYTDTGNLITPETQLSNLNQVAERIIETTYYYFSPQELDNIDNADQLTFLSTSKTLNYDTYIPKFVANAQKIRSVSAKESNYFNILQSIAETFECWLTFEIERENDGGITAKKVFFKNYIDNPNYAGFRYGVNLKNIKRTYESKKIVSKLIVKPNSNEFAESGFCTIARAGANPTGENYLYDFQYYFNTGMLNARQFLDTLYVIDGAAGPDVEGSTGFNLQGYFVRIKSLNNLINAKTNIFLQLSQDLTQYKAKQEVANAGYEAAVSGLQQTEEDFYRTTGGKVLGNNVLDPGLAERSDIKKLLSDYFVYKQEKERYGVEKDWYDQVVTAAKKDYDDLLEEITGLTEYKRILNQKFFSTYSRYIQEGTWIDEKYVDDELYYIDAQSVMYNSCYPQVAYSIDVIEVSVLPGLEHFAYSLGDRTHVEDAEFFGEEGRAEVIVTEVTEDLDDPTKNKIKVQNFISQFQDLFQKITATVQQAQYNSGSYEKAVALAEANQERKMQFLTDALQGAEARLSAAGQQSVTWGNDGITVKSVNSPCDAIRMVGGAILLSKQDKNGQQKWVTGVTSDGISASLITAGMLNAAEIAIMNYDEPVFRWDAFGISAYEATWQETDFGTVISGVNSTKFVRFDKHGIYGVNGGVDGLSWHPSGIDNIHQYATFALTWDGLKVTGDNNVVAHIGKQGTNIINITQGENSVFKVTNAGAIEMTGTITATGGKIAGWSIHEAWGIHNISYTVGIVDSVAGAEAFKRPSLISDNDSKIVYYAGSFDPALSSNSEKVPDFAVLADGSLYASAVYIKGGTISIGGDSTSPNFKVDSSGDVTSKGSFTLSGNITLNGNITWGTGTSPSQAVYHRKPSSGNAPTKPQNGRLYNNNFTNDATNDWHKIYNSNDYYVSYTYDGGTTWTEAIKFRGEDGSSASAGMTQAEKDAFNALASAVNSSVIDGEYIISPKIGGGYLAILKNINDKSSGVVIDPLGGYDNTNRPIFKVLSNDKQVMGVDKDGNAMFEGTITATGGTIGGFKINTSSLVTENYAIGNTNHFGIYPFGVVTTETILGQSGASWKLVIGTKFGVGIGGRLYAQDAEINGKITASEGKIGTWTIGTVPKAYINTAASTSDSAFTNSLYSTTFTSTSNNNKSGYTTIIRASTAGSDWAIVNIKKETDNSYTEVFGIKHDGSMYVQKGTFAAGCVLGPNLKVGQATDGLWTILGNQAAIDEWNAVGINFRPSNNRFGQGLCLTSSGEYAGLVMTSARSYIGLNAAGLTFKQTTGSNNNVHTSSIQHSGNQITIKCEDGEAIAFTKEGFMSERKTFSSKNTYQIKYQPDLITFYCGYQTGNAEAVAGQFAVFATENSNYVQMNGVFKATKSSLIIDSDQKLKKDIKSLENRYDTLFDNLIPRSYKWIDGTSGRTHSGYIVQEVLEALKIAKLTTTEFGAVVAFGPQDKEETEWGLRYEEFISLNTWQIQKLKPRMTAAEKEIAALKLEVQQLREQLASLKN